MTRSAPVCEVASRRPSGVKARAVGDATLATRVSLKPAGRAAADEVRMPASAPVPASIPSSFKYRTKQVYQHLRPGVDWVGSPTILQCDPYTVAGSASRSAGDAKELESVVSGDGRTLGFRGLLGAEPGHGRHRL